NCPLTDFGGKTSIFSHPVYLFLRKFSLQDFRGGSRFQDLLMAIKFLGNAGSHSYEKVTTDDLDNSYEIMNFILSDLYSDNRKKVSELANNLDKKFNPEKQKC
ncbi:TPA: DUF4145 domain-containing protein, partial [Escherichia coli]|nr:DUF4145 domain-containing protein [Escherichia coli]